MRISTTRLNLTKLPPALVEAMRRELSGNDHNPRSVVARRSLVPAMIAERLLHPAS